jgi:AraC-like DNA-binding protein
MKVSQIADQVGYNSADHFSRVFRGIYKESPLEYRKKHSQEEQFKPFQKEEQPRRPSL